MSPRRILTALALAAVVVLLVVGLTQLGNGDTATPASALTLEQMLARLRGSPAPLESLHEQANELLGGELHAIRSRISSLHGYPLVINRWASWCPPCRAEFGVFQRVSVTRGKTVAFIGIDSGETSHGAALALMKHFPVSYPSYYDPSEQVGENVTDSSFTPVTVMFNSKGSMFIHQGAYPSVAKLERDIERYALGG